jgi:hypothetical protein
MDKFDTICNQVLSEEFMLMEAGASLGDQDLALKLQQFTKQVATCADDASTQRFVPYAVRLIASMKQKVRDSKILQVIQQYEGSPIAALKALYQMLFTR